MQQRQGFAVARCWSASRRGPHGRHSDRCIRAKVKGSCCTAAALTLDVRTLSTLCCPVLVSTTLQSRADTAQHSAALAAMQRRSRRTHVGGAMHHACTAEGKDATSLSPRPLHRGLSQLDDVVA